MPKFEVHLHGTRGSTPAPGKDFIQYGGNTACVSVQFHDRIVVLDAGTGIVPLGQELIKGDPRPIDILLSHTHYDHIQGLPFFAPLLNKTSDITLWYTGCDAIPESSSLLNHIFSKPFLPFEVSDIPATIKCRTLFNQGNSMKLSEDIQVRTLPVNHPDGCVAICIEAYGKSFVYVPDFEHDDGPMDDALVNFMHRASFAVLDATYTSSEYVTYKGFGHTFWEKSVSLGEAAKLKRWVLFHHLFTRTDQEMRRIDSQVMRSNESVRLARDGMRYDLLTGKYKNLELLSRNVSEFQ